MVDTPRIGQRPREKPTPADMARVVGSAPSLSQDSTCLPLSLAHTRHRCQKVLCCAIDSAARRIRYVPPVDDQTSSVSIGFCWYVRARAVVMAHIFLWYFHGNWEAFFDAGWDLTPTPNIFFGIFIKPV